jgi:hypothetical protein
MSPVQLLFGGVIYFFILVTTFAIVGVLPIALAVLVIKSVQHGRMSRSLVLAVTIAAAFVTGGLVGWALRPSEWKLGIAESFYAGIHSEIYGHELESKAERAVLYFFLLPGDTLSLAAAVAALVISRRAAIAP